MAFPVSIEAVDLAVFATLMLLEGVLSFDNAAILASMARRLPQSERRKALLYGLLGAYVFRVAAILGAVAVIQNPILRLVGGAYLGFIAIRHFHHLHKHRGAPQLPAMKFLGLSAFWSTVVYIEFADIAFALDQIVVAVAFTDKVYIIIAAALVAILFLRLAAFYMARLMDWFPALEHIAYVVVGLVGIKIVAEYVVGVHVPEYISAPVTLGTFLIPVLVKLVLDRWKAPAAPQAL